jgi:transglutaminase-like putative cysteine protease
MITIAKSIELRLPGFLTYAGCLLVLVVAQIASADTSEALWEIVEEPAWASQVEIVTPQDEHIVGGRYYNVAETQSRFENDPSRSLYYERYVYTINNTSGLDQSDAITIEFDPLYQHVLLHKVQLLRGNQVINQLSADNIQLLQRETELEAGLYDGRQTIHILLHDQRVGDRVEYSYSVVGRNPVFGNHVFGWARLQAGVPVGNYFYRLRYPKQKQVRFKTYVNEPEVSERIAGDYKEITWQEFHTDASHYQSDTPYSFLAETYVQYSSFADWQSVARWGAPLYELPQQATAAVAAKAQAVKAQFATTDEQVNAIINFVQDEIRYTGINSGIGGFKPDSPEEIINRRYGDCKDKAVLMVALLQELGVTAYPVLVHSRDGRGLPGYLPSPDVFDHMIVKLPYRGVDYWVDGTMTLQGGALQTLAQGRYHHALVVSADTRELQASEVVAYSEPETVTHEQFQLQHNADSKATLLTVTTTYRGDSAEYQRASLQSKGPQELQTSYLNYYRNRYGVIEAVAPLAVTDNRTENTLVITEQYHIPEVWEERDDEGDYEVEFVASSIYDHATLPDDQRRVQPLAQRFPVWVRHTISVLLDEGWAMEPDSFSVENNFFSYNSSIEIDGDELSLSYDFKTLDAIVPEKSARKYIRDLKRVRSDAYYPVEFTLPVGTEPLYFLENQLSDIGSWLKKNAELMATGKAAAIEE